VLKSSKLLAYLRGFSRALADAGYRRRNSSRVIVCVQEKPKKPKPSARVWTCTITGLGIEISFFPGSHNSLSGSSVAPAIAAANTPKNPRLFVMRLSSWAVFPHNKI
jgi:hypothetical protein